MIINAFKGKKISRTSSEEGEESEEQSKRRKKRRVDNGDGLKSISDAVRASEASRPEIDRGKISFEHRRMLLKEQDRVDDGDERKTERDDRVAEMRTQREMMFEITSQNASHMQALMGLVQLILLKK